LSRANLSGAQIGNTILNNANCTNVTSPFIQSFGFSDMLGADFRGAQSFVFGQLNQIGSDGRVSGVSIGSGRTFLVRDYDGDPTRNVAPIAIRVDQSFAMAEGSTMRFVFEEDAWNSTISFSLFSPPLLDGTLELAFAEGVNVASQIGRTIRLFDWTGTAPTGAFKIESPYAWNLSQLYTTGNVTLIGLATVPGDYNQDAVVDGADYVVWREMSGQLGSGLAADGNGDGAVDTLDYDLWRAHFGQTSGGGGAGGSAENAAVPEPASLAMLLIGLLAWSIRRDGQRNSRERLRKLGSTELAEVSPAW
jgi:PEP-CTERM motif